MTDRDNALKYKLKLHFVCLKKLLQRQTTRVVSSRIHDNVSYSAKPVLSFL